jgi:hypothetical protein
MVTRGKLKRAIGNLKKEPARLIDLHSSQDTGRVLSRRYEGVRSVAIDQICGSEGRADDFDNAFNPLHERTRSRWLNIASLRLAELELPPVELIRLGETYFVRDGHHRISVAKALGEHYIDAEIILWDSRTPSQGKKISFNSPKAKAFGQSI